MSEIPGSPESAPQPDSPEQLAQRRFITASERLAQLKMDYALRKTSNTPASVLEPGEQRGNFDLQMQMADDIERNTAARHLNSDIVTRRAGLVEIVRPIGSEVFASYVIYSEGNAVIERLERVGVSHYVDEGDRVIVVNSKKAKEYQMPQTQRTLDADAVESLSAELEQLGSTVEARIRRSH
jgi:hypothetical protein